MTRVRALPLLGVVLALGCGGAPATPPGSGAAAPSPLSPWPTPGWVLAARSENERCDARGRAFQAGPAEPVPASPLAGSLHGESFPFATANVHRLDSGWVLVLNDSRVRCGESVPRKHDGHDVEIRLDAWTPAPPRRLAPTDIAVRYPFSIAYRPVRSCEPTRAAIEILEAPSAAGARGRVRLRIEWEWGEPLEGELEVTMC